MMTAVPVRFLHRGAAAAALTLAVAAPAAAQTEFQYQYGRITNPFLPSEETTSILTLQHAGSWSLGDSFFFIDYIDDGGQDGFNDKNFYGEWYPTLSVSKVSNRDINAGPITDIALIGGINFDGDADVLKYLPGVRASWQVPGFLFLNTDFTAFIDASNGVARGGAPKTGDSFMFDVNWAYPIDVGGQSFAIAGHAEYIGATTNEFGDNVRGWILAQPQFTWDLGKAIAGAAGQLLVGVEYQYWRNKLGVETDESTAQFLLVWRL